MVSRDAIGATSWPEVMRAVRSYVGRRISNAEDRDDMVQEVLIRIHRGLPGLKTEGQPMSWIYRIAHNAVVDYWRKRARIVPVPIEAAENGQGAWAAETNDGDLLQQTVAAYLAETIARLESPYLETLTLTELQGVKYADAARVLGVSLAAVKSRVLRGREMLRRALVSCCEIELGATGRVIDCTPRDQSVCTAC